MGDTRDSAHLLELVALIAQSVHAILDAEALRSEQTSLNLDNVGSDDSAQRTTVGLSRREALMVLEGACAQLCTSAAPPEHTMVKHAFAMITPACLRVALEARVAEHLHTRPKSAAELGVLSGVDAGKLGRVLRHLTLRHCFREVERDVFANSALSECLLPENATSALIRLHIGELYHGFGRLADVLLDPEWTASTDKAKSAFARAHGAHIFELTESDPVRAARFAEAMLGQSQVVGGHTLLLESYPWAAFAPDATFCDVGGGTGDAALVLLAAHPHMTAVVHDLPGTILRAHLFWKDHAPQAVEKGRVQLVAMDFFAEPPVAGCAVYYLKQILHDWPDDDCVTILRNVRAAMTGPNSRLLIHDIVLDYHSSAAPFPLLPNFGVGAQRTYDMDLNMMATLNSRERTLDELVALCAKAELQFVNVWDGGELKIVWFAAVPAP